MKKIFTLIALLTMTIGAMAQGQYFYEWKDGKYVQRSLAEVDSITFSLPESAEKAYKYVDLGLPSGTLWADRNVGADSPEDCGDYFAWGETEPKSTYNWSTYKWCQGSNDTMTKYCTKSNYGTVDNKTVLDLEDDAAYVNMGKDWRMPTETQMSELKSKCTWTWTTQNGTNGYKVTGPNGNSIFLPAAGYCDDGSLRDAGSNGVYWSASLNESYPGLAWYMLFDSSIHYTYDDYRDVGLTVRAVVSTVNEEPAPVVNKVDLGLPSGTLWADRNVGADSPEAYGDYFAWGETEPKETYSLITYKWYFYSDENRYFTKYCTDSFLGIVDNNTVLDLEDDAAYKNMGKEWRMPTEEELGELNRECTWEWIIKNGINGYKVTGSNGNSIFLPAAGLRRNSDLAVVGITGVYWSSSLYDSDTPCAHDLFFTSNEHNTTFYIRDEGRSVRAVAR
jgi:hypothetical protein